MKRILTALSFILISYASFGQGGKFPITVSGSGGGGGTSGGRYTTNDFGTLVDSATINVYKIIVDTTVIASQTRLSTMLALKLNIADTSGMLSAYQTAINARVKYTDTSSMLQKYRDSLFDYNIRISGNTTNIQRNSDTLASYTNGKITNQYAAKQSARFWIDSGKVDKRIQLGDSAFVTTSYNPYAPNNYMPTKTGTLTIGTQGYRDIQLVTDTTGRVVIANGWGLNFVPAAAGTSRGPDFGTNIGGINYRPAPWESMTKNFFLFRGGQYIFENDSAVWSVIFTPTGVNIGSPGILGINTTRPMSALEVAGTPWTTNGNVSIGNSYARTVAAPTNGLIVQGNVGINTSAPYSTAGLDISNGTMGIIVGADGNANTRTNNNTKISRFGSYHYTNATNPMTVLISTSTSTDNILQYGYGTGSLTASTQHRWGTATNNTTNNGTERMRMDSVGRLGIGTTIPTSILHLKSGTTAAGTAPLKLAVLAPALNTTAEKYAVEVDSATGGGGLYYTSANAIRNKVGLAAYGELYEDGGSTAITVTTAGTYYQWSTSTVGSSLLTTLSAATDNITIATGGDGTFLISASVSFVGTNSATQKWAVFKNGSRLTNLTSVVHMAGSALQLTTSLTGLVALAATDTIDLRVTSDTNGDTSTPAQVNLNITRLSK